MIFEIELKRLIKEKYGSVRAFSQAVDMPYSTIDNIFKRGILGVSIQVVLRICSELNIDVDKIEEDKLVLKSPENIQYDETYSLYELLDAEDKAEIRGEMKQMLKADKYSAKADVYDIGSYDQYAYVAAKGQGTQARPITDKQREEIVKAFIELNEDEE